MKACSTRKPINIIEFNALKNTIMSTPTNEKIFQYSDGSTITMSEIERNNLIMPLLSSYDIEVLKNLKVGETFTFEIGETLTRTK
jgi:hypothetical protein